MPFVHDECEQLTNCFNQQLPPAIFGFGPAAAIYFSDVFCAAVKGTKLKRFTFADVVQLAS